MTAGIQPTDSMGAQLPCRIDAATELTATNAAAANAALRKSQRVRVLMRASALSSLLVTDKLA